MSSALLKKLGVIAGLLLLLMGIYLYRQVPHAKVPFAKASAQAERVSIEQGSKKIELQKQGNGWKVSSGSGIFFPVEDNQVQTLLSDLDNVQIEDEISDRADRASDYEVNMESGTHLRLFGAQGINLGEGIFGKQAPDIAHIYFRYPDNPNVYLARGLLRGDLGRAEVNAWRSRQLIDIPETKIQAITMEGKGFKTELVRISTDDWTMNGKVVEPGPVNVLVGTLAHLRCSDFVDPAVFPALTYEGLTNGRVIVKGADSSAELRIGSENMASKQFSASINKEAGLVWLPESVVQSILQKPFLFKTKMKH